MLMGPFTPFQGDFDCIVEYQRLLKIYLRDYVISCVASLAVFSIVSLPDIV